MELEISNILDLNECDARDIFKGLTYPWEALGEIKTFIKVYAKTLASDFEEIKENVWVGKGTIIEEGVLIKGPAIIGYNCELRHNAYIRENVILGNNVVVGNSSEIKNSILFNKGQVPHYNYVGDSILGYKAHLGAGTITSNLKSDGSNVTIKYGNEKFPSNLRKFGAILGDNTEVGCNSVLNPGTVIGRNSTIYPLTSVRGYVNKNSILKNNGELVEKK